MMSLSAWGLAALALGGCGNDGSGRDFAGPLAASSTLEVEPPQPPVSPPVSPPVTPQPPIAPQPPVAPTPTAPLFEVAGWLPTGTGQDGRDAVTDNIGRTLDEVNPFFYTVLADGSLCIKSNARDAELEGQVAAGGGRLVPVLFNLGEAAGTQLLLRDGALQQRFADRLTQELVDRDHAGLEVNFEYIDAGLASEFETFLRTLKARLKAASLSLTVDVPAKRSKSDWPGYDLARLAAIADRIKVLGFGEHGASTGPGPIASRAFLRQTLDFAVSQVAPGDLVLGIPVYGYDWADDGRRPEFLSFAEAQARVPARGNGIAFDGPTGEATFSYSEAGVSHTVWFQDDRAIAAKSELAAQYQLQGVALWVLGAGDSSLFAALAQTRRPQSR